MVKIVIYSTATCGYCAAAERLLAAKGLSFERIDVTGDEKTRRWLREKTGRTSVPQIFFDDKAIGGYTDLAALDDQGALDKLG